MSMQSVLARLPGFLSGSAGRAIKPIEQVAESAAAHRVAIDGLHDGSMTLQQAETAFEAIPKHLKIGTVLSSLRNAEDDLVKAVGSTRAKVISSNLDYGVSELRTPLIKRSVADRYAEELALPSRDDLARREMNALTSRVDAEASAEVGAHYAGLLEDVARTEVVPELERVAAKTAFTRLAIGTVGVGGAIAGTNYLRRSPDEAVQAPAPADDDVAIQHVALDLQTAMQQAAGG